MKNGQPAGPAGKTTYTGSVMTRRTFIGTAAAAARASAAAGWVELFNGRDLDGWRPSENKASWKVFRNFELEVEALAHPQCNSGVYFHTAYQEHGFPIKGFEIQINNTSRGEGTYLERKKTGSLYGIRNIYKQLVPDDEWFRIRVAVRGKNVAIHLNGMLVVDYTEPNPPVIPEADETGRFLSQGTFALQCHNDGSKALFRTVRVRSLPNNKAAPGSIPVADDVFRRTIQIGRHNVPLVDYHVRLTGGLGLEQALRKSRRDGIEYGIVFPAHDDQAGDDSNARAFAAKMKQQPAFTGLVAGAREVSPEVAGLFDYVIGRTAMIGKRPIDICTIAPDDDMKTVIAAAVKNSVAIGIGDRSQLPAPEFIRAAKSAGCRFAFGTDNAGASDLGRSEYGLKMVEECKLVWQDFFVPSGRIA